MSWGVNMGKTPEIMSLLALAILGFGTIFFPNDLLFMLASNEAVFQFVRVVIVGLLMVQLMTEPPRHFMFRLLTGSVAVLTSIWTIQQLFAYNLQLFDLLTLVGSCLVLLAASLEPRWEDIEEDVPDNYGVRVHHVPARKLAT